MKEVEKLLQEYKIRFRDTDRIKGRDNKPKYSPAVSCCGNVFNQFGQVRFANTKGWATADLKKAPRYWVVQKDESNPIWEEFLNSYEFYKENSKQHYKFYSEKRVADGLDGFVGFQFITLEQWKHFFGKPEPKVGDCGFFWQTHRNDFVVGGIRDIIDGKYLDARGQVHENFCPIDVNKSFRQQVNKFLSE